MFVYSVHVDVHSEPKSCALYARRTVGWDCFFQIFLWKTKIKRLHRLSSEVFTPKTPLGTIQ